ncbi:hypothetical protein Tco_1396648 [Tanacetum coccineum]
MAHMGFCDKHNMVAFLQKPSGSEEFHQIVDFLAGSHIKWKETTPIVDAQHTPTASSSSTSQPTTSQPTSSQAPSSHEPTTEPITTTSSPHPQELQIP